MTQKTAKQPKAPATLMVLVPLVGQPLQDLKDWLDLVLNHNDTFMQSYCGYWARGMRLDSPKDHDKGEAGYGSWLVYEESDGEPLTNRASLKAFTAAKAGKKLPKHWHLLNEATATRAFQLGVEQWGLNWLQEGDASNHDVVIQKALLGEVVYG